MAGSALLENNNGPLVNIAAWFCLAIAILAMGGKTYTKFTLVKQLDWTDASVIGATLASVGMVVATAEQVHSGLGRIGQIQTSSQANKFYLSSYLATFFYILAVFISKFACLYFCQSLTRGGLVLQSIRGTMILVALWTIVSLLVLSFQCSLPNTWLLVRETGTCIQEIPFWITHGVFDLLTQVLQVFFPLQILQDLHTDKRRKRLLMLTFVPNLLTIPCIIFRMIYLHTFYSSTQPVQDSWKLFIIDVIHANTAIIFACMPFAKPILDSLNIGAITNDIGHGLVWDQMNYLGYSHGRKSSTSPNVSKIKKAVVTWPRSVTNSLFRPTNNDTLAQTVHAEEDQTMDPTKIHRTVETTVEAFDMESRSRT